MLYVPLKHLKPGMVLAKDVVCGLSVFALIITGQQLTTFSIARLKEYGVAGVYIKSPFCEDIEVESFIDPEFKQQTIAELKNIYDDYAAKQELSSASLRSITNVAQQMMMMVLGKDECLINVMEMKSYDTYTYTHSMYVGMLSVMIGVQQGLARSALEDLAVGGLLHDLGKMNIAHEIVNKRGKLTDKEFEIMKTHPTEASKQLWASHRFHAAVIGGIESHHEKFDGTGYPRGLAGKDIPLYGRILALADVYDALTSERPYRKAWLPHEAIEYMLGGAESHFDFDLLQSFLRVVAAYPVGTVVRLSNGITALVTKNDPDNTLRPQVRIIEPLALEGEDIDLAKDREYLNVTVVSVLSEDDQLPDALIQDRGSEHTEAAEAEKA